MIFDGRPHENQSKLNPKYILIGTCSIHSNRNYHFVLCDGYRALLNDKNPLIHYTHSEMSCLHDKKINKIKTHTYFNRCIPSRSIIFYVCSANYRCNNILLSPPYPARAAVRYTGVFRGQGR